MASKQVWAQFDVSGLVNAVHIAKGGGDREHGANFGERLVDTVDLNMETWLYKLRTLRLHCEQTHLFRGSVEVLLGRAGVVNAVLLATGDADFHLEPDLHLCHALKVLRTCVNVLIVLLLGEVEHVARKERLSVLLLNLEYI